MKKEKRKDGRKEGRKGKFKLGKREEIISHEMRSRIT